jgi:hypothetical protein
MTTELTRGNIPIPDPSLLTTEQLRRELAGLREVIETRLVGMDRATELTAAQLVKIENNITITRGHRKEEVDRQILALREYVDGQVQMVTAVNQERFAAVNMRFQERDTRTEETAQQSRISLDAALAAAKEAVSEQNKANTLAIGKSEAATQKQIDSMDALIATITKSLESKIGDVKERLDRGDGKGQGMGAMWGYVVGGVGILAVLIGLFLNLTK